MTYSNGPYYPTSEIDKGLLASIPLKVFSWMAFLDVVEKGYFGDFTWDFASDKSTIFVDGEMPTQIWVEGALTKPDNIFGVEAWMSDISNNLVAFTAYEKRIYDIMEELTVAVQTNTPEAKRVRKTQDVPDKELHYL